MALPFCFLHNAAGDVDLTQGLRLTSTLSQYVVQRLGERLSFFLGEWFLDQRQGVPYFAQVYGERPDLALLDTLYRTTIQETVGVVSVTTLLLSFDNPTRTLLVQFECVLSDGTTITQADLGHPLILDLGGTPI